MTSVQSKVVLEELPPQEEPRHDLFKRVGVSNLDLQRMETFLWGGNSKGVSILGNLTIYSSSEHERILALERAKTYIQSICCTDNSVNVTFNDDIFFASARHAWDWINREYNRTLIVIVGGGDCEWNSHRLPFHVSGIRFDEIKKKATFNASLSNWQQLARIYDLHLDSVHPDHPVFQRRSGIGNFFNDIGHDIKSVFSGVTPATQIADTVISDITSGAVGAVNTVTSVVPSVASPAISDITSKAVGAVNTAASIVPSVATSVISEVTSHAIGAISTVSSIASSDFSLATSVAHSIATSIANEAKAVVTGALGDMMDGGILIPFNMSVPSYTWSTGNGDLNIAIDCSNCGVSGGFDVQFHAHGNWSNVLNLDLEQAVKVNITLSPRDVSMKIEPKILVSANISGAQTNEQQLLDIPLWEAGGLRIPGVLSIGPHGVVSVGYELKDLTGFMNVSTGTAVSLPNNARAELLLELPLPHVSASSWHASISHVPFDIDGRLQGGLKIYAKAELQIQAEGMGNGFDAYINLQPYIGANISLTDCKHPPLNGSESVCVVDTHGHQFQLKAIPSAGGNFNAGAARAVHNGNPLINTVFASVTKMLPTRYFDFGPYLQTQRIVPVMARIVASSSSTHSARAVVPSAFWRNSIGSETQITAHTTSASPVREFQDVGHEGTSNEDLDRHNVIIETQGRLWRTLIG